MTKALFLDVDGVLNSSGSCLARTSSKWMSAEVTISELLDKLVQLVGDLPYLVTHTLATLDPTAVGLVNRLFDKEPTLVLVLSTSHRTLFQHLGYGSPVHIEALAVYFKLMGINAPVYGVTPMQSGRRGLEVAAYLAEHPEINEHLAIDDGTDFHPEDCILLRTNPNYGFSGSDYFLAASVLCITENSIIV